MISAETDWPAMAAFMGATGYLRQAFAVKPGPEADFVAAEMGLPAGARLADVGCGPGRHLPHWRRLGLLPVGFDLSPGFRPPVVADALRLPLADDAVDAAVALCGVAGTVPLAPLVAELERVARRVVVVAAFHLAFARRHMGLVGGRVVETVRLPDGTGRFGEFLHAHDCYQPDDLPGTVYGVEPGDYRRRPPSADLPELLAVYFLS